MRQIIIIGYGPAGISAAIYLKRSGFEPLVIGKDHGALKGYTGLIDNYYGLKAMTGDDLIQEGLAQAKRLNIDVIHDTVLSIVPLDEGFQIVAKDKTYEASRILLATGKTRTPLSVPGFKTYLGKGISLCAACDGYFFRKKKVAVIGCGDFMKHEVEVLEHLIDDITIFTNNKRLEVDVNHLVVDDTILEFKGDHRCRQIVTSKQTYDIDGIFIALGTPSTLNFAKQLGIIIENNNVLVNTNYETNVEGVYAIGDMIGGQLQISKAVYDGMSAAIHLSSLFKSDKKNQNPM
jgi:thioredoxin reductase (NADPH)